MNQLAQDKNNTKYTYVSYKDIQSLSIFNNTPENQLTDE